jgi:undecaprenyl diphosphate synthase
LVSIWANIVVVIRKKNNLSEDGMQRRTSGEQRLSNFVLWDLAYTELVFAPVLWPDFTEAHLDDALREFTSRCRRFGCR